VDHRLQEMLDHHEIRKVLSLYCHACDRADEDLMRSVYTAEGSYDDHGIVKAPGPVYAREMTAMVKETTNVLSHTLGQSIIQVDGDTARAETFFLAFMTADGDDGTTRLSQLAGRFVDRLERTADGWKIKHRIAVHDLSITHRIAEDFFATNQLVRGTRGSDDPGVALLGLAHRGDHAPG
jgi:ketosteroid isomerase-like protein